MKNIQRRSYWKLSLKEKQMINNIMLKQEGYFSMFNISIMTISVLCIFISISQNNIIFVLIISLIMFLVLRFKMFYYYLKHTEINFDINSKENNEMSKYTDNQTKFILGIFGVVMVIGAMGLLGVFDNNDTGGSSDNGYKTNCYPRSDGKICCTSCKKTSYGDIGCGTTCN